LLTADERVGVALVLALVAASEPGSDLLNKTSCRIEKATQNMLQVSVAMDENCFAIVNSEDKEIA